MAFFTLKNKKRLIIIETPQFILLILFGQLNTDSPSTRASVLSISITVVCFAVSLASVVLKLALLAFDILSLLITAVIYKYLRYKLAKHFGSKAFDLRLYVLFEVRAAMPVLPERVSQIDKRINQLLGVVYDPKHPDIRPSYVEVGSPQSGAAQSDSKTAPQQVSARFPLLYRVTRARRSHLQKSLWMPR